MRARYYVLTEVFRRGAKCCKTFLRACEAVILHGVGIKKDKPAACPTYLGQRKLIAAHDGGQHDLVVASGDHPQRHIDGIR